MFKKTEEGLFVLEKFAVQPGIIHGFSGREFGDMRVKGEERNEFLSALGLKEESLVLMDQVHGDKVRMVGKEDRGKKFPQTDGIVTNQKGVVLGVRTSDCLPMIFYDPKKKIIGVAHGGWKGILSRIGEKTINQMEQLDSEPKDIIVGVGPHIGGCCYTVDEERAQAFVKEFADLPSMVYQDKKGIHLVLVIPAVGQLIKSGVKKEKIEVVFSCTSCENNRFFSFRKDSDDSGDMLGVISLKV